MENKIFNQRESFAKFVSAIEKNWILPLVKQETIKPFFTMYIKERHVLNPLRFIFGKEKIQWFEEGKQPIGYKNAFEYVCDLVDIDLADVTIK